MKFLWGLLLGLGLGVVIGLLCCPSDGEATPRTTTRAGCTIAQQS